MKCICFTLYALVLFSLLTSCSPLRRINMLNTTTDTAKITWELNEDSLMNNPFLLNNSKKLEFKLLPGKKNQIQMSFGEGNWTKAEVQKLTSNLESFEIESKNNKLKIESPEAIRDFLIIRRKAFNKKIEIVISE